MRGPLAGFFGSAITMIGAGLLMTFSVPNKPVMPTYIQPEIHSPEYQSALFEASRVYGKAGCGDEQLAELTAQHAISSGLPAQLIAAQIATESSCNPMAVSNRGAIGLRQICVKVWSKKYDFTKVNLLNPNDNMTVADEITRDLVKRYGVRQGLMRYYGLGDDGIGLGGSGYADRVLQLAGKV